MHLDRLNEELIAGYGKKVDKQQTEKLSKNTSDINKE